MSRSMMPLPRCSAPAACASFHSLSSRTSINFAAGLELRRSRVSSTLISLTRLFASSTIFRKPSECFMNLFLTRRVRSPRVSQGFVALLTVGLLIRKHLNWLNYRRAIIMPVFLSTKVVPVPRWVIDSLRSTHHASLCIERKSSKLANEQFDVTVIGSGPGGYVAAIRAGQLGLKVAIVEKDKRLGGTCTLRGCIPTKQLLMSAHIYEQMQHAADFGVQASAIQLAFADVQKRTEKVVMKNSKGIEYLMKKNKVTVFKGTGRLVLPGKVEVTGEDGSKQTIQTKNIIIATGSVVRPIPGFDTDGKQVVNSDHILELTEVPKSLIVMGCGAVGVEV